MLRPLLWLLLIPLAVLLAWLGLRGSSAPEVTFAKVRRDRLVSALNTNGKVEPLVWRLVSARAAGPVLRVPVERGQTVREGQLVVEMDTGQARVDLAAAEARISQSRAELEVLRAGGNLGQRSEIESSNAQARSDLAGAEREYQTMQRLQAKNAATASEVEAARQAVSRATLLLQSLERRRSVLVGPGDKAVAEARLREAQSAAEAARLALASSRLKSPLSGTVYELNVRPGAFLNPGDVAARVGRLDRVRVLIYVDEPELGRVQPGLPVTITWDAQPGKTWNGHVETAPTQIASLGTRQVGEVIASVDNSSEASGAALLPGTNVSAEIRSRVAENALTIPREALRRQGNQEGVLVLRDNRVQWQAVETGITSVTQVQIRRGLSEGDAVALTTDRPLPAGQTVKPVFR